MSQTGRVSRLSKTNRADHAERPYSPSIGDALSQPLTERDGVPLRAEVRDLDVLEADRPVTWRHATWRWRDYIRDREDVTTVFENDAGDQARGAKPHRFHPDYADKQYAKLKDLERGISDDYGKRLHTAMLTFSCSSTDAQGNPRPPVDHYNDLNQSWDAVRRALDRVLEGRRYERLAILEPHQSGYIHIHMGVLVDGVVTEETFAPVLEAHVTNCDGAEWDAHDLEDDDTLNVYHAGADRDRSDDGAIDELAIYLAEYLGTYGDDPLEAPEHVQAANALLWSTGIQRWRPSNGAQSYMKTPTRDDGETTWTLLGIEKGDDSDLIPCGADSGGVERFTTGPLPPPAAD